MGGLMERKSILLKKLLFTNIFLTNEGSLGNAQNGFIREYDFWIGEKWMDGEQHQRKIIFARKNQC